MKFSSIAAFSLYIIIMICIGIFSAKKSRSASGYILGNRGLGYWVTAISANASDMSVWLFMGLPMAIFDEGLIHVFTAIGLIFFMFLNWHFIAPKLRLATEKYDALTLFTFFERRLGQKSHAIRMLGALISTVFLTIYISAGITGMGYLFESIFGLDYALGCTVSIFAILVYISLGGFNAICYTDFAQGMFLLVVILLVPALIFFYPNSPAQNLPALKAALSEPLMPSDWPSAIKAITLAMGWGIGYFGQPHILNKFMAIKNPADLNKSKYIGTVWQILALLGAVASGLAAHYFFTDTPKVSELIFVEMVNALFSPFFAAFVLCAILAATLSTVDSQILVVASVIAEDFYAIIAGKKATDKNILLASRLSAIAVCITALIVALFRSGSIFNMVFYCWAGIGCSFGPLVIASLYFKKLTKNGAIFGIIVGGSVGSFWNLLDQNISATLPGFLAGLLTIWLVSRI